MLAWTARSHSNELFLLATLLLVLGGAVAAEQLHLSLPIGAFVVGMVVGESDFRHQLAEEIRPLRDLLLGLFFLTVGMAIDWRVAVDEPATTFTAFGLLVAIKVVVVFLVLRWGGVGNETATRTALLLAHGGEFALLVISQTLAKGLVPASFGQPLLLAVALSMLIAPAIAQWNGRMAAALWKERGHPRSEQVEEARVEEQAGRLRNHVILAGCGPTGRLVATALEACDVGYVAIERDPDRLRRAQAQGHNVVFGDATRHGILRAAGIEKASAVISLLDNRSRVERLLREIRMIDPGLPVIVSTRDDLGLEPLVRAGATHIFPENLAAGLALATQTLIALGMPVHDAVERIRTLRIELNPELDALPAPPPG